MAAVAAAVVVLGLALPVAALTVKEVRDALDRIVFVAPELRVVETPTDADSIRGQVPNIAAMDAFQAEYGAAWRFMLDERRGVPTLVSGGGIPFIPGPANALAWEPFAPGCHSARCIPVAAVEAQARELLARYQEIFGVDLGQLAIDPDGSGAFGDSIYFLRFQWQPGGIPVERGSIELRINGGNLIQVATENVGPISLGLAPDLSAAAAWQVLRDYLGPFQGDKDRVLDQGSLHIVPVTPAGMDPNSFTGPLGSGIAYRLVYRLAFVRPGVRGTWEALVDAHSGELLRFVDANRYGHIHGGAYPGDNHVDEADRPFPFADTGLPSPDQYADAGGLFPGDTATTHLTGKYTWINDASCGTISNTTSTGDVDFSLGSGTDCAVPSPNHGGAGNTHSARTQYYHLTNANIKARTYMPTNNWLNNDHMNVTVNQSPYCNASSGGGTIYFYQGVPGSCWNLGEIPGVALHEWGHSMDDYDGSGGDSPPVECRADWTAAIQIHDSCTGRGFFLSGNCSGYGDACLSCTGIRDADYTKHQHNTPWTPVNQGSGGIFNCGGGGSYNGPCGWEDHCESGIATQALWDFVNRDLTGPPLNLDVTTAWMVEDRLFWTSMPTLGNMYTCTPPSSNGCNGGSLYSTMMAIDDDDGNLANGTPHAAAIFAALNRHNIACGTASDPKNQNHSACPTLTVGTLTVTAGSNAATLSWLPVANATRYLIFRNDVSCDAGFTRVAVVLAPTTTYTDDTVVNGIEYYYRFQAATDSDSCTSLMSACAPVTPQPCAGSVRLDRATYNCADTISISITDSDLAGGGTQAVTVWSTSEPLPETVTLIESPAGSGTFAGSIATSSSTAHGDNAIGVANGDTITVRYVDASYCGVPNVNVDATATADCAAPQITGVSSSNVTGTTADVSWTTNEAATSVVTYDVTRPPTAHTASSSSFVTSHTVGLSGLTECTPYFFQVSSTDPAGNSATATNGGAYYQFTTLLNVQPNYTSTDTPLPITDFNTTNSVIAVPDVKTVTDVNLTVNITHTWDGDLELSLIGPNGVQITLANGIGGSGDNYTNTVFDDEAATSIDSGSPPYTGSFRPEQPLSTFDGINAAGNWTFRVYDGGPGDVGTIDSWTLSLTYPAGSCPDTPIFADDFESGTTNAWSYVKP